MTRTASKQRKQPRLLPAHETVEAALAPYQDPWRLLNATAEEIRGVIDDLFPGGQPGNLGSVREDADGKPHAQTAAEQAEELIALLEALREMFTMAARGELFTPDGEVRSEEVTERFLAAEERAGLVLQRYYGQYRPGFVATPQGIAQTFYPTADSQWVWWKDEGELDSLADYLNKPLRKLFAALASATPRTVLVCENCGRLGPAERTRKRFCDAACRTAAYRKRRKPP